MNFPEWLRRITGLSITVNFNGPTLLNFGRSGKRGKYAQLPRVLAGSTPQARRPLRISLAASPRRDRLLTQPTDPNIRESWAAVARDVSARRP